MKLSAFDVETSGRLPEFALQPWRVQRGDAWLTSFVGVRRLPDGQAAVEDAYLGQDMRAALERYLRGCIERGERICTWFGQFDIAWVLAYGLEELVFQAKWLDGMLLWRHATVEPEYDTDRARKKSYGLKEAVAEAWPEHAGYGEDIDFHSTDPDAVRKRHAYNIRDSIFTLRLTKRWMDTLSPQQLKAALIEADTLPIIARANLHGMPVDVLAARELEQHLTDTAAAKLALLAKHGVTEAVVRSPTKLASLMFDDWQLPVLKENVGKKTEKVTRSTDKEVLHELSFLDPRAKELRAYREALNNRTKFATGILDSVAYNEDGHTHPQANVFGTYTSRLTYSSKQGKNKDERPIGFALHQEKRHPMYRGVLIAPPGHTLMEFDAAGQEYRWMAIASGDEAMLSLCQPGEDPHAFMGAEIAGVDYRWLQEAARDKANKEAGEQRQMGKVGNLSCQYRVSAKKLLVVARVQYDMGINIDQATHVWGTYRRTYRGVKMYWEVQPKLARRNGYVETFAGRRVQLPTTWGREQAWQIESTAINYPIQGTGGDQKYLALSVLREYIVRYDIKFAWDLHDGLYFYVPDRHVARAAAEMKAILDNLPYKRAWGFVPPIPLPFDCKFGKTWGALKEWRY